MSQTHWEFKIRKPGPLSCRARMILLTILCLTGGIIIGWQHGYEFGKAPVPPENIVYPKSLSELPCITDAIDGSKKCQSEGNWATGFGCLAGAYEHPLMLCNGPDRDGGIKDPGDLSRLKEWIRCYPCENIPKDQGEYIRDKDYVQEMYRECWKYRELFNGDQTP